MENVHTKQLFLGNILFIVIYLTLLTIKSTYSFDMKNKNEVRAYK